MVSRRWCAVALIGCLAGGAGAAQEGLGRPLMPGEVGSGTLLLSSELGAVGPAPTLETDVDIAVTGMVARTRVTQRFVNPTDEWLEGVYVFPLPDTAAVDQLHMLVGSHVIEGQIREREEAQRLYNEAKESGRKASLLKQERPNIFTSTVANVGPQETVEVAIEYEDTVPYDGAEFALRFPLVVAPRYIPGRNEDPCRSAAGHVPPTADVPDADRITPPVDASGQSRNPVRLTVELDTGFPLKWVYSPTHPIATQPIGTFVQLITLADDEVPADRDFVLLWAPANGHLPGATLLAEQGGDATYALLMVMPPDPLATDYRIPRETIFIIDTSGSMAGQSIEQAKLAMLIGLDQLQPEDHFNVIQFNTYTEQLFPSSVQADAAHIERAREYVGKLSPTGGTEMLPALTAALVPPVQPGALRQVIFMTDGGVGNEAELFAFIQQHLRDSRLFTVGIGSAPNAFFMRKAAQFGRGTFTFVGGPNEVSTRMDALFRALERPTLTDVDVDWGGADAEAWPARIPDLYSGQPLVVAARLSELPEAVTVSGHAGAAPWRVVIHRPPLETADGGAGIRQLWARRTIDELMDKATTAEDRETARDKIVQTALQHHLVTNYTSLVAVDVTPTAPDGVTLLTHDFPVNAPHGSAMVLPSTATPARLYALLAALLLLIGFAARGPAPTAHRAAPRPQHEGAAEDPVEGSCSTTEPAPCAPSTDPASEPAPAARRAA
jgi:Ca-activated chloride channel family protein